LKVSLFFAFTGSSWFRVFRRSHPWHRLASFRASSTVSAISAVFRPAYWGGGGKVLEVAKPLHPAQHIVVRLVRSKKPLFGDAITAEKPVDRLGRLFTGRNIWLPVSYLI
jgi:hypothetical protein